MISEASLYMRHLYSKLNLYFTGAWGHGIHSVLRPAIFVSILVSCNFSSAQITVTQNANAQTLAQLLTGSGVTISNYTISGDARASGTFNNVSSDLGLGQGVVLSTGMVTSIPQAASSFASTQFTNSGDAQLATLTTGSIYDVSILQFDITPQGSTLQFNYVFASEEYPQFVCSPYNDVFGFFITGPNPSGGNYSNINLATLPNSALPVCINSVNPGVSGTYMGNTWSSGSCLSLSNSNLYVNNLTPTVNPNIVYNGMTTVLTATASVVPCQTYHLKIAIADVGDRIYDSGVFLQAYSFTSTPYSTSISSQVNTPGYTSTYRGCVDGSFTVSISAPQSSNVTVNLATSGTAVEGLDYDSIPTTVIIPAGQTSVTIPMNPIQTNLTEPTETVILSVVNPCTGAASASDSLTIQDDPVAKLSVNDSTLCKGKSAQLTATGGFAYNWSPAAGLSNDTASSPVATPSSTTTYSVGVVVGSCVTTLSQKIYVSNPSVSIGATPGDTICTASNIQLAAATAGGVNPYTYLWNNNNTTSSIAASTTGSYSVVVTDSFGCTATASRSIIISNVSATGNVTPVSCFGDNNGAINLSVTSANSPFNYSWNDGPTSANRSNLAGGNYTVTVTNSVACTATATFNIIQPTTPLAASATPHATLCNGDKTGSVNLNVTGGVPPFHYSWNNSDTAQNLSNIGAGGYTATVTDFGGCSVTAAATVAQPAPVIASATPTNEKCAGGSTGSIQLTPGGGTSPYTYSWNNLQTTQNINSLTAGIYTVTVEDINHCSTTQTSTINTPTALTVSNTPTNPGCGANATGSIALTVNGGTPNYSYLWNNNATSANISGITSGAYSVTVTDNNGCTATSSTTIASSGSLTVAITEADVKCNGANNGSISLLVSGGVSPYTYNWNGTNGNSSKNNLGAGNYDITVTDINSCSATLSTVISQPTSLNLLLNTTNVKCFGSATGSITPTVTGGTAPYTYSWTGNVTSQNDINLIAGNYNVTVTDSNLCSITGSASITQPATALNATVVVSNVSCFGNGNGAINLTPSGGTGTYSYNWGGNITSQNRSNLTPGNYNITITDINSCTFTASATITQPNAIAVTSTQNDITCNGANNGSISLQVSGGISPYTYNWNGTNGNSSKSNLGAGNYQVTVSDINSCSSTIAIAISQPAALHVSLTPTNVSCFGDANGAINLNVTGGTLPYQYNWGGNVTTQNRSNLNGGNYNVTVTDSNACSITGSASITQPAAALNATVVVTNVSCFGNGNGAINLTPSGGTGTYTYNWGGNITSQNRNNLTPGNYNVTITDVNSCTFITSATITQANALSVASTQNNITCNGANNGSINLQVSGGTSPYSYNWNGTNGNSSKSNLGAGNYQVTVSDVNSCSSTLAIIISQPAALNVSLTPTNISCFGAGNGAINLTVTGGTLPYQYNWGGNVSTQNRSSLSAGNYNVTVTDSNSCSITGSASVTQPVAALNATTVVTNATCNGGGNGAIALTVTGGSSPYTYNWGGAVTTQNRSSLQPGNYTVTVTDINSCSTSASATVAEPGNLTVSSTQTNINCNGANNGSISLKITGGTLPYTYSWNGGDTSSTTRSNLGAGTYTVTVTDVNSCSSSLSDVISQPNALNLALTPTNVSCFGMNNGAIDLTVTGGTIPYTYRWAGGTTTQNRIKLIAGNYAVTVTDSNSCVNSASATVTQPASTLSATPNVTDVNCYGGNTGAIALSVTGGTTPYSYNWGPGINSQNRNNLSAGNYNVTVTDGSLCSATAAANVTQPTSAMAISPAISDVSCNGGNNGSISLNINGGTPPYAYNWSNNSNGKKTSSLAAGSYTVTVQDTKGCIINSNFTVSEPAPLALAINASNVSCFGSNNGKLKLTVTGGTIPYLYKWNTGTIGQDLSQLPAGNYSVQVVDSNNCSASGTFSITQPTPVQISGTADSVLCSGSNNGSIKISVTGGAGDYSYSWSNNSTSANLENIAAGTYNLTVTDVNACTATSSETVNSPKPISVVGNQTNELCHGAATANVNLTVTGGTGKYSYLWNNSATTPELSGLKAGNYFVTVSDINACSATKEIVITEPAVIMLTETHNNLSCNGTTNGSIALLAAGGVPAYHYAWNNGDTTRNIANIGAGSYSVSVTDANGCFASLSTIMITEPTALNVSISPNEVACYGSSSGEATSTVTGGTAPYQYHWSNDNDGQNIASEKAGTYILTVTDANGCSSIDTTTINTLPPMSVTGNTGPLPCANAYGDIIPNVTSGTPPYTFRWSNSEETQDLDHVHPGMYSVTISDANKCKFDTTFTITNLNNFDVKASGGGTVEMGQTVNLYAVSTGSPLTHFDWTPSNGLSCTECANTVAQPGETTIYTVIGTDTNGCTASDTVSVDVIEDHSNWLPNAFTPNGDGNNDYFQMYGNLEGVHEMQIMIFDRWGEEVYESSSTDFKWDGTYKGKPAPLGVYAFVLKLNFLDGSDKMKKGSVTLIR